MDLTCSKYQHDIEEIAENFVEYRERLEEENEEDILLLLEEFLEDSIVESDWFVEEEFSKVLEFTNTLHLKNSSLFDRTKSLNCMKADVKRVVESFDEVEYEEISEEDSLDLLELDFDL